MDRTHLAEEQTGGRGAPMLSQFEYNLLHLIADDYDLEQICRKLNVSAPTVLIGIGRIRRVLDTKTTAGAAVRALRLGILV